MPVRRRSDSKSQLKFTWTQARTRTVVLLLVANHIGAVASMRRTEALASVKFYQILSIFIFFIRLIILEDFIRLISYNGPCVRLGCSFFLATALHLQQRTLVCVKGNVILASSTHEGVHFVWSTYNIFLLLHMPTYYKLLNRIRSGHVDLFWLVMHFNLCDLHIWKCCSAAPSV